MYLPKQHEETNLEVMHDLIRAHSLGTWVTQNGNELIANHIPFYLDTTRGEFGTLIAHVARANPIWQTLDQQQSSLVIFQGPESYITPSWYPGKYEHGKVVPTWNYAVVHAQGVAQAIEDRAWLRHHLEQLTDTHEADRFIPWKLSDAPAEFTEKLMEAIVGIEMPIQKLIGKWKAHQHRSDAEKLGVVAGLMGCGDDNSLAMADLVKRYISSDKIS